MKPLFLVLFLVNCTLVSCEVGVDESKITTKKRRLQQKQEASAGGPCAGFSFTTNDEERCTEKPSFNPDKTGAANSLSVFAEKWIAYTCCNIVKEPLSGIIASVWLWLQVCTNTMNEVHAHPEKMILDKQYGENVDEYGPGPLQTMKYYCPSDLDGGELTEWVVSTFFPVMERYNEHFKASQTLGECSVTPSSSLGAVTVLLAEPSDSGTFGHISMVLHKNDKLKLPKPLDSEYYISFSNYLEAIGVMITGTKAEHVKFGHDLNVVNKTMTLYNADIDAMLKHWQKIKDNKQLFDLLEWNCARTVLEVLNKGYPGCKAPLGDSNSTSQLWTPNSAYGYISLMQKIVNEGSPNGEISVKKINARYIPKIKVSNDVGIIVVCVAVGSFAFNVILALIVIWAVIRKMQADAEAKLERGLAKIILYAGATWPGQVKTDPRFQVLQNQSQNHPTAVVPTTTTNADDEGTGVGDGDGDGEDGGDNDIENGHSTPPPRLSADFSQDLPDDDDDDDGKSQELDLLCPSPHLADVIVAHMDMENNLGVKDGETDKNEFIEWGKKVNLDKTEIELVWKELDRNGSGKVDKREWDDFIHRRKKLKWLIGTMKSVRKASRAAPPNVRY